MAKYTHAIVARDFHWPPDYWDFWLYNSKEEAEDEVDENDGLKEWDDVRIVDLSSSHPAAFYVNTSLELDEKDEENA